MRYVCQFSCGAASAVATKLILTNFPEVETVIVNAFIKEEHADNRRFAADCEKWFGKPITALRNELFGASTVEVWRRRQYIKGPNGAPCSLLLKRDLLNKLYREGDVVVIGFTKEEEDRKDLLLERFHDEASRFKFPLIEFGVSKEDCLAIVAKAGIELPMMYRLGFQNANCIGCPKGGQNYWQKIRKDFPAEFEAIRQLQEEIGPGAYFLQFRSGPRKGQRMSLSDLPPGQGNLADEASFECGFVCELVSEEYL